MVIQRQHSQLTNARHYKRTKVEFISGLFVYYILDQFWSIYIYMKNSSSNKDVIGKRQFAKLNRLSDGSFPLLSDNLVIQYKDIDI